MSRLGRVGEGGSDETVVLGVAIDASRPLTVATHDDRGQVDVATVDEPTPENLTAAVGAAEADLGPARSVTGYDPRDRGDTAWPDDAWTDDAQAKAGSYDANSAPVDADDR